MSRRFETIYRVKRRDNLGDPEYWNNRLEDIDRRVDANETALTNLDEVAARVEGAAFDRINNVITPIVVETINRVGTIANLFTATSSTPNPVIFGRTSFVIDPGNRETFAHQNYVSITPSDDLTSGFLAPVASYDRATGLLVVDPEVVWGSGVFSNWDIAATQPASAHVLRKDNPHETTADQVGAYTKGETDAAIKGTRDNLQGQINTINQTVATNKTQTLSDAAANALALAIALG
jgi:hypothetical protein